MSAAASPAAAAASAATPEAPPKSPAHAEADDAAGAASSSPSSSPSSSSVAAAAPEGAPRDEKRAPSDDAPDAEDSSDSRSLEEGETEDDPPLPREPVPEGPPLPNEPVPEPQDDGWECRWEETYQAWYFVNRFTGATQWENPRVSVAGVASTSAAAAAAAAATPSAPQPPANESLPAGGYNPAIHGDYDPNAWYAQAYKQEEDARDAAIVAAALPPEAVADPYAASMGFNRWNGQAQAADMGPGRHSDEAKSRRQMNAFFDVDAAANQHDGRSLKAERQNQRLSKTELKAFKEKRRARKEEKRRAWLLD